MKGKRPDSTVAYDKANGQGEEESAPKKDRAWFERKVAELKTELEKLPADRQEQLRRELDESKPGKVEP
jgi:hypothetical protein